MTLRTLLNMATVTLLCAFSLGHFAFAATPSYRIDMTVLKDGSLVGKPAVVAEAGAQAELRDENPLEPNDGFRILITASSLGDSPNGAESVQLHLVFFGRSQGKWIERGDHSVTALVGKNVSFSFPPSERETAGKKYDLVLTTSQVNAAALKAK